MSTALKKLLREPLLHFAAAGIALFVVGEIYSNRMDTHRIVVTPQREAHLATRYSLQFGAQPDSPTLEQLVQRDIDEEILFRHGLALGLDRDDEIVRRRIVQKMEFLLHDLNAPAEPGDTELNAYYQAHRERYTMPARVTFSHVYFAPGQDENRARARAAEALDVLSKGAAEPGAVGDSFPDRYHFAAYELEQVQRLFGRSEFAEAAFSAPLERWMGPYRSGYGWHLLRVAARHEAQQRSFSAVRDKVRTDYLLDAQTQANATAFNDLAGEFTVVRERS